MFSDRIKNIAFPFIIIASLLLPFTFFNKGYFVLVINKFHNSIFDELFKLLSALGNGVTIAICAVLLFLCYRLRYVFEFAIAFLIQSTVVILFKYVFFAKAFRPYKYFSSINQDHLLNTVEGVRINLYNTFPSGHTATIFLIATFFALLINNRILSYVFLIVAFFVGISRIYLVQHFYLDVYFGLLFGASSVFLAHYLVNRRTHSWYDKKVSIDLSGQNKKSSSTLNA